MKCFQASKHKSLKLLPATAVTWMDLEREAVSPQPRTLAQSHRTLPKQSLCWFPPRDLHFDLTERHTHLASLSQEQDKELGCYPGGGGGGGRMERKGKGILSDGPF